MRYGVSMRGPVWIPFEKISYVDNGMYDGQKVEISGLHDKTSRELREKIQEWRLELNEIVMSYEIKIYYWPFQ